jgi:osmotically inducible protein OsmC
MALVRSASAVWKGDLQSGTGSLESATGNVSGSYSFASRFENGTGTNPEELIAAAHAACFSMAFSNGLAKAGHTPTSVTTTADVTLDGGAITTSALTTTAVVPGIDQETFDEIAAAAKAGCPVSKLYTGAEITLDATLES